MATRVRVTAMQRQMNYATGIGQAGARRRESNRLLAQARASWSSIAR